MAEKEATIDCNASKNDEKAHKDFNPGSDNSVLTKAVKTKENAESVSQCVDNSSEYNLKNGKGESLSERNTLNNENTESEPIPGSSNDPVKDESSEDHTVWLSSTKIKSETEDDDSRTPESEEESEEELGEEERLEEDSDEEMEDESDGGAYHLAEVSYGEENEESQKGEGTESDSLLGISHDCFKSPEISKNTPSMSLTSNVDKDNNLNDKDHFKSADISKNTPIMSLTNTVGKESSLNGKGSRMFVKTVILTKTVSIKSKNGETKLVKHFKCPDCNFHSFEKHRLVEHTYKHKSLKPYQCPECGMKFTYASYLREHRRITHLETPFDCKFCGRKCGKQSALDKHLRIHTGEKPFGCDFCDYRSTQQNHITVHMRQHTGDKPYRCQLCDYKCAYSALLKRHVLGHTGEKVFSCSLCDYKSKTNESLQTHIKRHSDEKPFSCDHCTKSFHTRDAVKRHIKNIHLHNQFKCDDCNINFKREMSFKMHMDEHNDGGKRYTCKLCDYKCGYKLMLNKHMVTHTSGTEFMTTMVRNISKKTTKHINVQEGEDLKCSHCIKSLKSKLSLKNHIRYKHFPNKYICNICNLTFMHNVSLKLHMTQHLTTIVKLAKELS